MIDKVSVICPNIGMVYSGMGPDFRVLVAKARKSAQAYWKIYGEYPPTKVLTQEIANIMQQATQSGYVVICLLEMKASRHHRSTMLTEFETVVYGHMVYLCWWRGGISRVDQAYTKSTPQARSGHGRRVPLGRTW